MDDALYTGDLDLGAVGTRDDLAALLRTVHIRADKPSLRTLEARTRHSTTPLSKTAVAEMLKGTRFPRKTVMVSFLRACGVADNRMELWRRTWERVAADEERTIRREAIEAAPSPGHAFSTGQHSSVIMTRTGDTERTMRARNDRTAAANSTAGDTAEMRRLQDQIRQLNSDNGRLRAQLAATRQQTTGQIRPDDVTTGQRPRSPVVSRRELGALLGALRAGKGMTLDQVAEHLECKPDKVRRMETGFRSGTVRDVRDMCDLYKVSDTALRDHLIELFREGKQQGWWQSYDLPYSTYIGLEADAASIKNFNLSIVPGILQTADYARALHVTTVPTLSPESIEQGVETRLIRQRRLSENNALRVWSILDEAALHRVIGGPAVMRSQLERLIEFAGLPNITIQVIPFEVGAHPALESDFIILEFATSVGSVVYVEGLLGSFYRDRPQDIKRYQMIFDVLSSVACDKKESITKIADANANIKSSIP